MGACRGVSPVNSPVVPPPRSPRSPGGPRTGWPPQQVATDGIPASNHKQQLLLQWLWQSPTTRCIARARGPFRTVTTGQTFEMTIYVSMPSALLKARGIVIKPGLKFIQSAFPSHAQSLKISTTAAELQRAPYNSRFSLLSTTPPATSHQQHQHGPHCPWQPWQQR